MFKITATIVAATAASPFVMSWASPPALPTPAPAPTSAAAPVKRYANFESVPANQAPNTWFTDMVFESNGNGYLTEAGHDDNNQFFRNIKLTQNASGGSNKTIAYAYKVTFIVVAAPTDAENQHQAPEEPDYDLYVVADDDNDDEWAFTSSSPYTYEMTVPVNANGTHIARRVYFRTFEDSATEGYETVILRITDIDFVGTPPSGLTLHVGDRDEMRWLIRDAVTAHSANNNNPPVSDVVMQYGHTTRGMAGLDFSLEEDYPATNVSDRTQPTVKFITEGEYDKGGAGPVSEDYFGVRFYVDDEISACNNAPLDCGGVVGTATSSDCEFEIDYRIDSASTATYDEDYEIFDFTNSTELAPTNGIFTATVNFLPFQSHTEVGDGFYISAYKNTSGTEAAFEDVIIHIVEARRLDGCTLSDEPVPGWNSMAIWVIEDN